MDWKSDVTQLAASGLKSQAILKRLQSKYPELSRGKIRHLLGEKRHGTTVKPTQVVQETGPKVVVDLSPSYAVHRDNWEGTHVIRFGVISDTHIGSKSQQISHLRTAYDTFEGEGIDTVYHVGDLSEGEAMRQGHVYECFLHGGDEIGNYIVDKYPCKPGIRTRFIIGNHDTSLIQKSGTNLGMYISNRRSDMEYLGALNATVYLTPNCTLELNHPLDGSSYAYSYSIQKYADSMMGGTKPSILLSGHHHKMFYMDYRNIHILSVPALQAQTPWMRGKRIAAHVGFFIVTVMVDKSGTILKFTPDYYPFYTMKERDWE